MKRNETKNRSNRGREINEPAKCEKEKAWGGRRKRKEIHATRNFINILASVTRRLFSLRGLVEDFARAVWSLMVICIKVRYQEKSRWNDQSSRHEEQPLSTLDDRDVDNGRRNGDQASRWKLVNLLSSSRSTAIYIGARRSHATLNLKLTALSRRESY